MGEQGGTCTQPHGSHHSSSTNPLSYNSTYLVTIVVTLSYTECTTVRVRTLKEKGREREREDEYEE
jgi:hypothetical protein